jgi:undecaprenyl diphosphate synthase
MQKEIPSCVGFIMDGNRRWANREVKQSFEGHLKGYEVLKEMIRLVHRAGIPHMVCYAFSTENWKRAEKEVHFLTQLMQKGLASLESDTEARTINYRIIGEIQKLPEGVQQEIANVERGNHEGAELTVWIALSYGGRAEIVEAANKAIQTGTAVTEETFAALLSTNGMPDPDLIIRTSGEKRISNFLLWQSAYSEFVFTDTLWPDFGEAEFQRIVEEYGTRDRRKGS